MTQVWQSAINAQKNLKKKKTLASPKIQSKDTTEWQEQKKKNTVSRPNIWQFSLKYTNLI